MSLIASSYKDRDTEEALDIYFYRPIGLVLAHGARFLHLTPNVVTVLSGLIGILGGHCLYYPSIRMTVVAILLLVLSDALDSADGQLARITGRRSQIGRMLDGLAGNLVFLSIYIHLVIRYSTQDIFPWILLLAIGAAACHSFQSALADYFRNGYLYFVRGAESGELHSSSQVRDGERALKWSAQPFRKVLLVLYRGHTCQQEWMARRFVQLRESVETKYHDNLPGWVRDQYRAQSLPLVKYYNILTINTRMIALFVAALLGHPYLYFVFELTILNAIFVYVIVRQEQVSSSLLGQIAAEKGN